MATVSIRFGEKDGHVYLKNGHWKHFGRIVGGALINDAGNTVAFVDRQKNVYNLTRERIGKLDPLKVKSQPQVCVSQQTPPPLPMLQQTPAKDNRPKGTPPAIPRKKKHWGLALVTMAVLVGICLLATAFAIHATTQSGIQPKNGNVPEKVAAAKKPAKDFVAGPLDMDWSMRIQEQYRADPELMLDITVKGKIQDPKEQFALIHTDETGKSEIWQIISKGDLILGSLEFKRRITPKVGSQMLTLKSYLTEKDVCQKEIAFWLTKVAIKDVHFEWERANPSFMGNPSGKAKSIKSVELTLEKEGNLPVSFKRCFLGFSGKHFKRNFSTLTPVEGTSMDCFMQSGVVMMESNRVVTFLSGFRGELFEPGEQHRLEVRLPFGDGQSIDFQKEIVVP